MAFLFKLRFCQNSYNIPGFRNYKNFDKTRVKLLHNFTRHQFRTRTNLSLITSAFAINKVQILFTFTLVRATSVDAHVELICAVVQVFIQAFVNI